MMQFLKTRITAVGYALEGWRYVLRTQRNAWIHTVASLSAIGFGFWLKISAIEWAILTLTIAMVWGAEFFNTALEAVVDLVSPDTHPLAKIGKDVGAAAVLIAALAAVIVGLLIFMPHLLEEISALL